jgi:chromosome segregation ATPase
VEQSRSAAGAATARADELVNRVQSAEQRLALAEDERRAAVEQSQQTARELGRLEGEVSSLRQVVERLAPGPKDTQ